MPSDAPSQLSSPPLSPQVEKALRDSKGTDGAKGKMHPGKQVLPGDMIVWRDPDPSKQDHIADQTRKGSYEGAKVQGNAHASEAKKLEPFARVIQAIRRPSKS